MRINVTIKVLSTLLVLLLASGTSLAETGDYDAYLIKDINPGTASSSPYAMTVVSDAVYFVADDTSHGREIWKSDGTEAGTMLVKDLWPGPIGGNPQVLATWNGDLYFTASDGAGDHGLWRSDGTAAGTVMVQPFSTIGLAVEMGGALYFTTATQLWKTDGTSDGTEMVKDGFYYGINEMQAVGNRLFFPAYGDDAEIELWASDGTAAGTVRVKDIYPGGPGGPSLLTEMNGMLFFVAQDGSHGYELWHSDGTEAGTAMVKDICPGEQGWGISSMVAISGTLFFDGDDCLYGRELWKSDGTPEGTTMVKDLTANGGSAISDLASVNGLFFFFADNGNGYRLWKSDGTAAGTAMVTHVAVQPMGYFLNMYRPAVLDNRLFFVADDGVHGPELWMSDGTEAGTAMVEDIWPGYTGSGPQALTVVGRTLYFSAAGSKGLGSELWSLLVRDGSIQLDPGGPYSTEEGGMVALAASGSAPDGGSVSYSWDLDNNGAFETTGSGATFSALGVDGPASVSVGVRAVTQQNLFTTKTATILVANAAPSADAGGPYTIAGDYGGVTLQGMGSDPGGASDPLSFAWDLDGDGVFETEGQAPYVMANQLGGQPAQTVVLKVSDDEGAFGTDSATISGSGGASTPVAPATPTPSGTPTETATPPSATPTPIRLDNIRGDSYYMVTNLGASDANTMHTLYTTDDQLSMTFASSIPAGDTLNVSLSGMGVPASFLGYLIITADQPIHAQVVSSTQPTPTPTVTATMGTPSTPGPSPTAGSSLTPVATPTEVNDLRADPFRLWTEPVAPREGVPLSLGVVVSRVGGQSGLSLVPVRFYRDSMAPENQIGEGMLVSIGINDNQSTSAVTWPTPQAGTYTILAHIDPDNQVVESDETNNIVSRAITIQPPAADSKAPVAQSLRINGGAQEIGEPDVTLEVTATDAGGSGLGSVLYAELHWNTGAQNWVPVGWTGWQPYGQVHPWMLKPNSGLRYIQAWVRDNAGNISIGPAKAPVNLIPAVQSIKAGEVHVYRRSAEVGQCLTVRLQPNGGDADLYVWPPNYEPGGQYWSSLNGGSQEDSVQIQAEVAGLYQIEVEAFSDAGYSLSIEVAATCSGATRGNGTKRADKTPRTLPAVPIRSEPAGYMAVSTFTPLIHLPTVQR